MSTEDRELARDCWVAIGEIGIGPDTETPEWLAATAATLSPVDLVAWPAPVVAGA